MNIFHFHTIISIRTFKLSHMVVFIISYLVQVLGICNVGAEVKINNTASQVNGSKERSINNSMVLLEKEDIRNPVNSYMNLTFAFDDTLNSNTGVNSNVTTLSQNFINVSTENMHLNASKVISDDFYAATLNITSNLSTSIDSEFKFPGQHSYLTNEEKLHLNISQSNSNVSSIHTQKKSLNKTSIHNSNSTQLNNNSYNISVEKLQLHVNQTNIHNSTVHHINSNSSSSFPSQKLNNSNKKALPLEDKYTHSDTNLSKPVTGTVNLTSKVDLHGSNNTPSSTTQITSNAKDYNLSNANRKFPRSLSTQPFSKKAEFEKATKVKKHNSKSCVRKEESDFILPIKSNTWYSYINAVYQRNYTSKSGVALRIPVLSPSDVVFYTFHHFDESGDRFLDAIELTSVLVRIQEASGLDWAFSDRELETIFDPLIKDFDLDQNGKFSYSEFRNLMK